MFKPRTFLIAGVVVAAGFAVELAVTTTMWGPPTYPAAAARPVLTKAQHQARGCQSVLLMMGTDRQEIWAECGGDVGAADAIDPYRGRSGS